MTAPVTYHDLDGWSKSYASYHGMVETFAASAMPVGWQWDENDRAFVAECDRYSLVQMYDPEGCEFDVVLKDGEPIGTLDGELTIYDISELQTQDQIELRAAELEAAIEDRWQMRLEDMREDRQ